MLSWSHQGIRLVSPYIIPAVGAVLLTHLLVSKDRNLAEDVVGMSVPIRVGAYTSLIMLLVFLGATDAAPFIYFQF